MAKGQHGSAFFSSCENVIPVAITGISRKEYDGHDPIMFIARIA